MEPAIGPRERRAAHRARLTRLHLSSAQTPLQDPLALELERLRSFAALERAVRERRLEFVGVAELVDTLGLSPPGFEELFGTRRSRRELTFDEAFAQTSAKVAAMYRARANGNWRERIRAWIERISEAYDQKPEPPRVRCSVLAPPAPGMRVRLWELPPAKMSGPYRHRLTEEELLVVLEGRPTLLTAVESRDLKENEATAVMPAGVGELRNSTSKRVRFLALSSSSTSQLRSDP